MIHHTQASHRIIAQVLADYTGQELSESRRWRMDSALGGLIRRNGLADLDELAARLSASNSDPLAHQTAEALLNNETYFFRDPRMYEVLANDVLPDLAAKRADTRRLSIWSAGCSTGQEALSLAIMFASDPAQWADWHITIDGTDVSRRAVTQAQGFTTASSKSSAVCRWAR